MYWPYTGYGLVSWRNRESTSDAIYPAICTLQQQNPAQLLADTQHSPAKSQLPSDLTDPI